MDERLHLRAGSTAEDPFSVRVTPDRAGWGYAGLRVLQLQAGVSHTFETGDEEMVVLPLSGGCTVACEGQTFALNGRASVFEGVSDFAYVPRDAQVTVRTVDGGRFAVCSARCRRPLPPRYGPADRVSVELRGAGGCSRQIHNFCRPDTFDAERLIAVEVLTPAGNWSSYPPHKHDEERPGEEASLEEIYYFEMRTSPDAPAGAGEDLIAYQRVYGTSERPLDVLAEVRPGDVVLVPHGWHGPSMAVPGYDLYYLNVMAGPGQERAWRVRDDPAHAWIREAWADQAVDPRLPLTTSGPADESRGIA